MRDHQTGGEPGHLSDPSAGAKSALRDQLRTARGRLGLATLAERSRALTAHLLQAPEVRGAGTVAAYVSLHHEPGTTALLDALVERRVRVLLPVVQPDLDLDWAPYAGPQRLVRARRGLLEPDTEPLGHNAIGWADAVLLPGQAVDHHGNRLGQGGGCYDRALARVPVGTFTCVLLHSEEIVDAVPVGPWDRPVTAAATELGVTRFGRLSRGA